ELDHVQIKDMAAQVHGYPPAATAITELARSYGPALAAAQGMLARNYSPRPLLRYLQPHRPAAAEIRLLRILAGHNPLPVPVLAQLLGKGEVVAGRVLAALIDASLVVPDLDTGWYRIAGPVAGHVERTYGSCSKAQYQAVAAALNDFLDTDRD